VTVRDADSALAERIVPVLRILGEEVGAEVLARIVTKLA
jgi:hypothetical protein